MMRLTTWVLGALAGAAVTATVLGGAAFVRAQEDAPATGERPFRERVAENLGVSVEELDSAVRAAALDAIDDALASGRITEEQAERLRERAESGEPISKRWRQQRHAVLHGVWRLIVSSSAAALGIAPRDLVAELRSGDSIADVAEQMGVSLDDVKAQIVADAQARLDEMVANGRITQEQADAAMQRLQGNLDDLLRKSRAPGE